MTGPLVLLGGLEHTPGCMPIDERLIEMVGKKRPVVTVVPVASSLRKQPAAVATARRYWTALGAHVKVSAPEGPQDLNGAMDALDATDIIVMTGGHPARISRRLKGSAVWDRILSLWRSGVALSGSSAATVEFCEWRAKLKPPYPFKLVEGLGLLKGCITVPHYDVFGIDRMTRWFIPGIERFLTIGLDEQTGLIGVDGAFDVLGHGGVTLVRGTEKQRYGSGESLKLPEILETHQDMLSGRLQPHPEHDATERIDRTADYEPTT